MLAALKPKGAESKLVDISKQPGQRTAAKEPAAEVLQPEETPMLSGPDFDTIESNRRVALARNHETPERPASTETMTADHDGEAVPVSIEPALNPGVVQGNLAVREIRNQKGRLIGIIRVEVEETLGHYAEWLDVPTGEIRRLNGFPFGRTLRISEHIKVPLRKVSKEEFEQRRYEYHKELAEDFYGAYRVQQVRIYRIKKGDNIWNLARQQFEVPP